MKKNKVPEIRFPGFTDDWELRKLGEVTESFDGKRVPIDSGLRVSGEYPYYGATGIIDYVDDYIFDGEYVLLAEDGANIIMRNYPIAYLTQGKFWLNNHAHIMRMIDGSNYFLVQMLEKIGYMKYNTGTAQPKLNSKIVKNIEFKLPHIEEQQKIGAFFKQIDDTITLHQRELEILKNTKKAFLQKMFPKDGEKVPEVRFPGFTDDWELRKLGEISDVTKLAGFEFTKYVSYSDSGEIIALRGLNVKNGGLVLDEVKYIDGSDFSKLSRSKLFRKDILFTYVGTVGELAVVLEDDKYYLAPNVARIRMNKGANPLFVSQQMNDKSFYNRIILPLIATSSQPALSMENVRKFTLMLPGEKEQSMIADFFTRLDQTITLHQRELTTLQNTKKAFLQKMFV